MVAVSTVEHVRVAVVVQFLTQRRHERRNEVRNEERRGVGEEEGKRRKKGRKERRKMDGEEDGEDVRQPVTRRQSPSHNTATQDHMTMMNSIGTPQSSQSMSGTCSTPLRAVV